MKKIMFTKTLYINKFSACCLIQCSNFKQRLGYCEIMFNLVFSTVKYCFTLVLIVVVFLITENWFYSFIKEHFGATSTSLQTIIHHTPTMTIPVFNTGVIFVVVFITAVFQIDQVRLISFDNCA